MAIASIIAAEWDAQTSKFGIQPTSMPFMILTSTAIDQILPNNSFVRSTCMSYLPTDTALYFISPDDRILIDKQQKYFNPLIDWANNQFNMKIICLDHFG